MNSRVFFLLVTFSLFTCTLLTAQTEFAADVTNSWGGSVQASKIFVGQNKMRIESKLTNESGPVILDLATHTTRVVIADKKAYLEALPGMSLQRGYAFFRPADVENSCDVWLKLVFRPGATCQKLGVAAVYGRATVEYEGKSPEGDISHVWLDTKLAFPIKWDSKGGGGELHNIQEAPQPDALFEIPADYKKIEGLSTTHHHPH